MKSNPGLGPIKGERSIPIPVCFPPSQIDALDEFRQRERITRSELIRRAVTDYLRRTAEAEGVQ